MSAALFAKCCGVTRVDDAVAAWGLGYDAVGVVAAQGTPRAVTLGEAAALGARRPHDRALVGVFVAQPVDEVARWIARVGLTHAQLHGGEDPRAYRSLGVLLVAAARLRDERDLAAAHALCASDEPALWAVLLDGPAPGQGQPCDLRLAAAVIAAHPTRRVLLAGGLRADNVAAAVVAARPFGVDASSGLEARVREKDHAELARFLRAARGAHETRSES